MEPHVYQGMAEQDQDSWYYRAKRYWLRNILRKYVSSLSRVIDIGCGTGRNACVLEDFLSSKGEYVGIEPEPLPFCPPQDIRSRLMRTSLQKIGIDEMKGGADLVMMIDVLEHIDEDMGLQNVAFLLKPGGHLLITVPAYMSLWSVNDVEAHHLRRYTFPTLQQALQQHGFELQEWNHYFSFAYLPLRFLSTRRSSGLFGPRWLGRIILPFALLEGYLGRFFHIPVGTGIICIARKGRS